MSLVENGGGTSPKGFKASGVKAGLKRSGAPDMAMIYSESPCIAAQSGSSLVSGTSEPRGGTMVCPACLASR